MQDLCTTKRPLLRITPDLTSVYGQQAANHRHAIGPFSPTDMMDLGDILSMAAAHQHANSLKCARAGYDDTTHARFEKLIGKFGESYTEPTPHDYAALKLCLTRVRGYFFTEYKHSLAEICSDATPATTAITATNDPSYAHGCGHSSAQEKYDAKLLESVYGDMTNLVHRLETKLAPYARPKFELV